MDEWLDRWIDGQMDSQINTYTQNKFQKVIHPLNKNKTVLEREREKGPLQHGRNFFLAEVTQRRCLSEKMMHEPSSER